MGIELATHPEWDIEEFRQELSKQLRKLMGADDIQRLKSLDVAHYVPPDTRAAIELERRGLPRGGVVQIAAFISRPGDDTSGQIMRCEVPRLMKWRDIPKIAQQLITPICKALGMLEREVDRSLPVSTIATPSLLVDVAGQPLTAATPTANEIAA